MPVRKHDAQLQVLDLPAIAIGSSADTSSLLTYWFNAANIGTFDPMVEQVLAACLTFDATVTGATTNNFAVELKHYNVAGTLVDRVVYTFASGTNAAAFVPIDISGAAAGALTVPTGSGVGTSAGFQLSSGDSLVVKRASNGSGLASPGFTVSLVIGVRGS